MGAGDNQKYSKVFAVFLIIRHPYINNEIVVTTEKK